MTADKHLTLLATLHLIHSGLGTLLGLFVFGLLTGIGALSGEYEALMVLGTIGTLVGMFLLLLSIPGIIGAIGLLRRKRWSRMFMIVIGALKLLDVPLGTILGGYTMYVLLRDDVTALLDPPRPGIAVNPA